MKIQPKTKGLYRTGDRRQRKLKLSWENQSEPTSGSQNRVKETEDTCCYCIDDDKEEEGEGIVIKKCQISMSELSAICRKISLWTNGKAVQWRGRIFNPQLDQQTSLSPPVSNCSCSESRIFFPLFCVLITLYIQKVIMYFLAW